MLRRTGSPYHLGRVFHWHADRDRQAVLHVDRPLDVAPDGGTRYDAAALAAEVTRLSGCLHQAGLRHRDTVVVAKSNHLDTLLLASAAARMGAFPVTLGQVGDLEAVRAMIGRARPRLLVAGSDLLQRAAAAGVSLTAPEVRTIAVREAAAEVAHGVPSLADLAGGQAAPVRVMGDDEPMIATHTSGTTGVPKLVVHTFDSAVGRFPARMERVRVPLLTTRRDDVLAVALSYAHIRTMTWAVSQLRMAPRKIVAVSDPSLETVERVLDEHRPTALETFPTIFQHWEELVERRPDLFARARLYVSTFDAVHPRTVRTFLGASRRRFPVWGWGLGQSEVTGVTVNLFTRHTVRRTGSRPDVTNVGWPAPGVRLRVVDAATNRRQPRGVPGLIKVSTRARCRTYLGEEERYRAKSEGSWWNSGDLGERMSLGRLRLLDREVDMIEGASSLELESTLLDRLPHASEVTVLGRRGALPLPVVSIRGDHLDPHAWARAAEGLPELAPPRLVRWEDLPRTATWKVRRAALRELVLDTDDAAGSGIWT